MTKPLTEAAQLALVEPTAAEWDAWLADQPQAHLLQSAGWAALKSEFGWQARRLALHSSAGVLAGGQLLLRRRFGLAAAYLPRGPLLSGDQATDRQLLAALERVGRRARAVFLRLEPNLREDHPAAGALHSLLLLCGYQPVEPLQPHSSIHLDLTPTSEQLFAGFSKGHRADVRRAAREGVQVRAGTSPTDLAQFYTIMQATSQRAGFGIHQPAYYAAVLRLFGEGARLWLAEQDGSIQAAAITCAWGQTALYLYSGSNAAGLKSGAQHAIQWQAIQWARERGCSSYDFWGIPDALGVAATTPDPTMRETLDAAARNDPLYGVYRFKKGFGGDVVRYLPAYDRVFLAPLYVLWQRRVGSM